MMTISFTSMFVSLGAILNWPRPTKLKIWKYEKNQSCCCLYLHFVNYYMNHFVTEDLVTLFELKSSDVTCWSNRTFKSCKLNDKFLPCIFLYETCITLIICILICVSDFHLRNKEQTLRLIYKQTKKSTNQYTTED